MRGEKKYYFIIVFVFLTLFLIQQFQREPTNYDHTFSHRDKNPYGGYVLKQLLPDFLGTSSIESVNLTLYEIQEELYYDKNLLIIADNIYFDDPDTEALLDAVGLGMTAFISATSIAGQLADTLDFETRIKDFYYLVNANADTTEATLDNRKFRFKRDALNSYFSDLDSLDHQVLAIDDDGDPVAITVPFGTGKFIFNTTPLAFTNNYLFFEDNADYAAGLLSELPEKETIWSEYYQLGRLEYRTPLRVVLTTPALKFAYTVTIITLLIFMVFEAKRKQRIIPIIKPLRNTTVEFVKTIGKLYLKTGDHKDIALKKIQFFLEFIRTKYYLSFEKFDKDFFDKLSAKSEKDIVEIKKLFDFMELIKNQPKVSAQQLKSLNSQIETFYGRKY